MPKNAPITSKALVDQKGKQKISRGNTTGQNQTSSLDPKASFIQAKSLSNSLKIGASNDAFEKEADAIADRIVRMPLSQIAPQKISQHAGKKVQKKCSKCEDEEKIQRKPIEVNQHVQAKASAGGIQANAQVSNQIQASKGGGNPLGGPALQKMQRGFGHDFSNVRIHAGANAAGLSHQLNAKAFTVGNDIYFGAGQYQPHSPSGQHLLAHELTHTIQQGVTAHPRIQRVEEVGLHSNSALTPSKPEEIDQYKDTSQGTSISGNNYYFQKIKELYTFTFSTGRVDAGKLDQQFWNAVLSRAWELKPKTLPSTSNPTTTTEIIFLPVSLPEPGGSKVSKYRAHCRFRYGYDNLNSKPEFELDVIELIPAPTPVEDISGYSFDKKIKFRKKWNKAVYKANATGFPRPNLQTYLNEHLEVRNPIIIWLQKKIKEFRKSRSGDLLEVKELVKVKERDFNGGESTAMILMDLDYAKWQGILSFSMTYTNDSKNAVSKGHDQKSYADFLRETNGAKQASGEEKLGTIKGLETISDSDERAFVETKAVSFFFYKNTDKATGAKSPTYRDTELDIFIPVSKDPADPAKTEFNYYTFIFHKPDANNLIDITVKKIGKKGDATIGNPDMPSLTRIPGFSENAYDPKGEETPTKLIKWVKARYPGISGAEVTASTVKEISDKANAIISAKSETSQWFKDNYEIEILDAAKATDRLKLSHKYEAADLVGVKAYSRSELQFLELSLQRMSPAILKLLKSLQMVRQTANAKDASLGGLALRSSYTFNSRTGKIAAGSFKKTVAIYDGAFLDNQLFQGGKDGINPSNTSVFSHELGHVVSYVKPGNNQFRDNYNLTFNEFMIAQGLDAVTIYAREKTKPAEPEKGAEAFPEAFMLFLNDPEWLLNNQFQSYFWMLYLAETGRAPSPNNAASLVEVWTTIRNTSASNANLSQAPASFHLWTEFTKQKSQRPNAEHLAIFPIIIDSFKKVQSRTLRSSDAKDIVKKWLLHVRKTKSQPTSAEVEAFFPNLP